MASITSTLDTVEADLAREADAAFLKGDKAELHRLEVVSELVQDVKRITQLFNHSPDTEGNFYRTLTNERCEDRHGMLDPEMLADSCPLDNGRHDDSAAPSRSPSFSLGALDVLPTEILQEILVERLDLATLTLLRRVSRSIRRTIDSVPHYQAIVKHAPGALRAALSLELASSYTCRALYNALCMRLCTSCQKFGAYLYVPTCSRVCYRCFTEENDFLPMTKEHAKVYWSITSWDMDTTEIPIARSIPGFYSSALPRPTQRTRLQLVNYFDAGDVSLAVHQSHRRIAEVGEERDLQKFQRWQEKLRVWQNTDADQRPRSRPARPRYLDWRDMETLNPNRFMCVIPFPWYNREKKVVQWGVGCNGCRLPRGSYNHMSEKDFLKGMKKEQILYSRDEYLGHFMGCSNAMKIFAEKCESDIVCKTKLFPWWHSMCHVVGDYSQRQPHPSDAVTAAIDAKHRAESRAAIRERLRKRPRRSRASTAGD